MQRICQNCNKPFNGRRDARCCSAACRQQAYRSRQNDRGGLRVRLSGIIESAHNDADDAQQRADNAQNRADHAQQRADQMQDDAQEARRYLRELCTH